MRTIYPIILMLAIALVAAFFAGSGFNAIVTGDKNTGALEDDLNDTSNNTSIGQENFESGRAGGSDGSIVGFIISGGQQLFNIGMMVLLLPITLEQLGFPRWFAWPLGATFEIVVSVGFVEFITGRNWT